MTYLDKRHDHVIRDLENILNLESPNLGSLIISSTYKVEGQSIEQILTEPNVGSLILPNEYKDKKGEFRKEYLLTKDGFILYMFNIQGHNDFKMAKSK